MTTAAPAETKALADRIHEAVSSNEVEMPPLPEIHVQLERLLADEDRASTKAVADLISKDPAITAGMLRIANSVAYGGLSEITDVAQAVARVGMRQVRLFVSAIVHRANFEQSDHSRVDLVRTLWKHAMSTAVAAKRLAEETGGDPERAFLAGMLHDTGKLLFLRGVSHIEERSDDVEITPVVFEELMAKLHTGLGYQVLSQWNLPEAVCAVARDHHADELPPENRLLLVVSAANAMSRRLGLHPQPDEELELMAQPAIEQLGLEEVSLAMLMVDVQDELDKLQSVL